MPILYVHGVNTRSRDGFFALKPYLQRYVAPAISGDPDTVMIDDVYWGNVAAQFAWDGASRPRSRLLGQGAAGDLPDALESALTAHAYAEALKRLPQSSPAGPATGGLIAGGARPGPAAHMRLRDLPPDQLSDLVAALVQASIEDPAQRAQLAIAADEVAHDARTRTELARAATPEEELRVLLDHVRRRVEPPGGLLGQGVPAWLAPLTDRLGETLERARDLPAYSVSMVAAELRPWLNELLSVFIGDVFAYLAKRGQASAPGEIPQRFLTKFRVAQENKERRGDEPLVVLSHSMGGQIVYDAVSHFLPGDPQYRDQRIDFWCATASQVGMFEELKLFLADDPAYQSGNPVPFPHANLGIWWNVWDHNDFLSFTGADIFHGVADEPYDSGMALTSAHSGYLLRPSFYRRFGEKLNAAAAHGWRTP
jgi:hypothetical protein